MPTPLSKDFTLEEFAVSASHKGLVRPVPAPLKPRIERLVKVGLQPVRDRLKRPMRILSGYRSEELNKAVGGSPTSQHVLGEAADFTCDDIEGAFKDVLAMIRGGELRGIGQVIYYPQQGFVHMATLSNRFDTATPCVHDPTRGLKYKPILPTEKALTIALAKPSISLNVAGDLA